MWGSTVSQVTYSCVTSSIAIVYVTLDNGCSYPLAVCDLKQVALIEEYAIGQCFIDVVCFIGELGIECVTHLV